VEHFFNGCAVKMWVSSMIQIAHPCSTAEFVISGNITTYFFKAETLAIQSNSVDILV
jgi:hypothetical protein